VLFHIGGTAAWTGWGMRVGGVCFFYFHCQGIWIDAKVVKIGVVAKVPADFIEIMHVKLYLFSMFSIFRKSLI
jgi:hypothetical protein